MRCIVLEASSRKGKDGKLYGWVSVFQVEPRVAGGDELGHRCRERKRCQPPELARLAKNHLEAHGPFFADVETSDTQFGNRTEIEVCALSPLDTAESFAFGLLVAAGTPGAGRVSGGQRVGSAPAASAAVRGPAVGRQPVGV